MKYTYADWLTRRYIEESKKNTAKKEAEKVETVAVEQFSVVEEAKPVVEDTVTVSNTVEEKPAEEVTENTETTVEQAPAEEEPVKTYKSNTYKRKTN